MGGENVGVSLAPTLSNSPAEVASAGDSPASSRRFGRAFERLSRADLKPSADNLLALRRHVRAAASRIADELRQAASESESEAPVCDAVDSAFEGFSREQVTGNRFISFIAARRKG
jgi:hypothetical protein